MRYLRTLASAVLAALTGPAAAQGEADTPLRYDLAQRTFEAACSSCHYRGEDRTPFGTRGPLADSSPDEMVQFILFGKAPEFGEGQMPGFAMAMTDADVIRLVTWLRTTSRPDTPWTDLPDSVARLRATGQRED